MNVPMIGAPCCQWLTIRQCDMGRKDELVAEASRGFARRRAELAGSVKPENVES